MLLDHRTEPNRPEQSETDEHHSGVNQCVASRADRTRLNGNFGANQSIDGDAQCQIGARRSTDILHEEIQPTLQKFVRINKNVENAEKFGGQSPQMNAVGNGGEQKKGTGGDPTEFLQ